MTQTSGYPFHRGACFCLAFSLLFAGSAAAARGTDGVEPGDVLKVAVFNEPDLAGAFSIRTDGTFDYPFVGRVQAAGRTVDDIQADIVLKLKDGYVRQPQVSIELDRRRQHHVFVVGHVRSPGKYPIAGQTTLLETLALAGFVMPSAGTTVRVLPTGKDGLTEDGRPEIRDDDEGSLSFELSDLQAGRTNIVMEDGYTVYVPEAGSFYVTGLVTSPGRYQHTSGLSVQQALAVAGGIHEKGSTRGIKILRAIPGKAGKVKIDADLYDAVEPGDTIIIRQRLL